MAFKKNDKPITFKLKDGGINELISEKNNTVLMLREVSWGEKEDYHLELRKWYLDSTKETAGKGVVFNTEDSPHTLTETLCKLGFGKTENIVNNIKDRPDFNEVILKQVVSK